MAKKSTKKVQQTQKKVFPKRIIKQKNKPSDEVEIPESD